MPSPSRAGLASRAALAVLGYALALAPAHARDLTWVAGQATGGWYIQTVGFADLMKTKAPTIVIKPEAGAAYDNMTKLQQGKADLAWSLPPVIVTAYDGGAPFTAPQSDVRLVMTGLGVVTTHFCVAADSPIRSVRDIFDKKLAVKIGSPKPGGSDEWELRKIFEFYKSSYADFESHGGKVVFGSFAEMADQYEKGALDGFIMNNAVPATDAEKAAHARRMRVLPMDDDLLAYLAKSGLVATTIAKGSYKDVANNDAPIRTAGMANTIVTSVKVPDDVIHDFTRALLDNLPATRAVHPAFADFDPKDATMLANVPLHPGAAKAYREAGLIK